MKRIHGEGVYFLVRAVAVAMVGCALFVVVDNFGSGFEGNIGRMRRVGKMFNDLGHVFIPPMALFLLVYPMTKVLGFSYGECKRHKMLLLLSAVLLCLVTVFSIALWRGFRPQGVDELWFTACGFALLFILVFVVLAFGKGVFYFKRSLSLATLSQSWSLQAFILVCLMIIPRWSGDYGLNFGGEGSVDSLDLRFYVPPCVFLSATLILGRHFDMRPLFAVALVNAMLIYFCILGYWKWLGGFTYRGPMIIGLCLAGVAALVFYVFWMLWHKPVTYKKWLLPADESSMPWR